MVADLIRGFVREDWVEGLDFDTLERVSEIGVSQDLREREDDIIWRLRLTDNRPDQESERWLYVLLDEQHFGDGELDSLRNVAAALFRLEKSRRPQDIERVLSSLVEWLQTPEQDDLRRAFVVWLKRVLLPARVPGVNMDKDLPQVIELQEMRAMLAERVKTWTEEWKQQGLEQGLEQGIEQGIVRGVPLGEAKLLRRQLAHRFGPLPGWVEDRLEHATEADLESWADRILDSQTLDEVFSRST